MYSSWMYTDSIYLREMIVKFKVLKMSAFVAYHRSGISTQEWNYLTHLVDIIAHVGGIQFLVKVCTKGHTKYLKRYMQKVQIVGDTQWTRLRTGITKSCMMIDY